MAEVKTRSELLASRKAAMRRDLAKPARAAPKWAPRLTGLAAAEALGYLDASRAKPAHTSRSELLSARRVDKGGSARAGELLTNLARDLPNPSVEWVDAPLHPTRSSLVNTRKVANIEQLQLQAEVHATSNRPDANARVQRRIDENVQYLLSARKGKTRAQLLSARRSARADEAEAAAANMPQPAVPRFQDARTPFWRLSTNGEEVLAEEGASQERLLSQRKWYAKPEVYSRTGAPPRENDPFKLNTATNPRFLADKLSSGPRKSMRGYPPHQSDNVALKQTEAPAPQLPVQWRSKAEREEADRLDPVGAAERAKLPKPKKRFTDAVLAFRNNKVVDDNAPDEVDGLQFTAPLYSSFTKSGVFEPPKLPKNIHTNDPFRPRPSRHRTLTSRDAVRDGPTQRGSEEATNEGLQLATTDSAPMNGSPAVGDDMKRADAPCADAPHATIRGATPLGLSLTATRSFRSGTAPSLSSTVLKGPRMSNLLYSIRRGPTSLADAPTVRSGGFCNAVP